MMQNKTLQNNLAEGWEVKKLGEIATLTSSKRIYLSDYVQFGVPFYRGKEVSLLQKGKTVDDILFISEDRYKEIKNKYDVPKKNDILITAVGTLGSVYRIPDSDPFYFKDGNLIWLKNVKEVSSFIEYLLSFETRKLINTAIGSSQKALTIVALNKVKFNIPGLLEQKRVVQVLEKWDLAIEKLDRVIELKKGVKKGLMQKLLTGDLRLSGFEVEWEVAELGSLFDFQNGFAFKSGDFSNDNGVRIIRNRDLKSSSSGKLYLKGNEFSNDYVVNDGDLLVGMDGDFIAHYWSQGKALLNQRVGRIRGFNNSSKEFVYYFIQVPLKRIENETSSTTVKHLSAKQLLERTLPVPGIKEQEAIAEILMSADKQIQLLEIKKAIVHDQKKYLLNNLVTGEIRTPENS